MRLDISFSKIGEVLEGPLNLRDFKDLRLLNCSGHKITELELGNHPQLTDLYCNKNQLTRLYISNFPKLINVDCSDNQLNSLIISICPKLTELYCSNNRLTGFDFSKLDEEKLTSIDLNDNDFSQCDLSVLTPFVNLKSIKIGSKNGDQEKIDEGFYNRFYGSLKHLKNMDKLEILNINATDIDEGLEYLPTSLKEFYCTSYGTVTKVEEIEEVLKNYPDILQDQQSPVLQPQNPFKDVVLLGVGNKEGDLSGLFSSLGPNYINNLRK